eukprot:CAMPEP_0204908408 /NCGR_PEP_ID=MMETSP1397-20131031/7355_1 /ASSEMBLY_ACC=CAM_ASM_000891 /TAXON_ID=49980 /ORGANISM="Climacostomum Climacostomum virens, Strain Stock W-24" /LENGTH=366 /DNA_ID=CAMNT_0052077911 /DNA_START=267 /DNA_END=1364 /DNA_ORIENTATION=+
MKNQGTKLVGHYKITARLGSGAFAIVYKATDLKTHREIALKLGKPDGVTTHEVNVMDRLRGCEGFPELYEAKAYKSLRYIAMQLLGHSAAESFRSSNKQISILSVIEIVNQGIDRLETLHTIGYIHRDIKPQHLIYAQDSKMLYLTDFGLSTSPSYASSMMTGAKSVKVVGNARFAGVNAHMTPDHSQSDDLESMIYIALYFMRGSLPWDYLFEKKGDQWLNIRDAKEGFLNKGCQSCPPCIKEVLTYLRSLRHMAKPDYDFVRSKVRELVTIEPAPLPSQIEINYLSPTVTEKKVRCKSKNKSTRYLLRKSQISPSFSPTKSKNDNFPDSFDLNLQTENPEEGIERTVTRKFEGPSMPINIRRKL